MCHTQFSAAAKHSLFAIAIRKHISSETARRIRGFLFCFLHKFFPPSPLSSLEGANRTKQKKSDIKMKFSMLGEVGVEGRWERKRERARERKNVLWFNDVAQECLRSRNIFVITLLQSSHLPTLWHIKIGMFSMAWQHIQQHFCTHLLCFLNIK